MKILIVDDERSILNTLKLALEAVGHEAITATNCKQANKLLAEERVDAMFVDLKIGKESGLEFLVEQVEANNTAPIILLTGQATIESAVESMRKGAYDYVQKPFHPEQIYRILFRLEKNFSLHRKIKHLESQIESEQPTIVLESKEKAVNQVYQTAFKAADSDANILILGPSGTGKSVLARAIHNRSQRRDQPFITLNCPSLSGELFESELFGHARGSFTGAVKETWGKVAAANDGTLFLDEIGEIPLEIQSKLLRLLQDREYERVGETQTRTANIRLVAATNQDLQAAIKAGKFREDLYYRIHVIPLKMPALAERPADILPLANNYLNFFGKQQNKPNATFSKAAQMALTQYNWPGNLRELRNVIERAVILSHAEAIDIQDLPDEFNAPKQQTIKPGHLVTLSLLEEEHIKRIIAKSTNIEQAAKILGIDTATLYRKKKKIKSVLSHN